MRIITGSARGRRLVCPDGLGTRPILDAQKQALFNVLGSRVDVDGVMDIFAGSGGLGLEALSRGARRAVFVEKGRAALDCLRHFTFETVMYPVNFIEHHTHRFDPEVLTLCRESGAAVIAIKPISAGSWKPGEQKTRGNYWYKALESQDEINLAMRFALSLDPVVSAIPTSFLDLNERAIIAGKGYQPATEAEFTSVRALAEKYSPLFPRKPLYLSSTGPHARYYAHA